jgi:hypothetical protein
LLPPEWGEITAVRDGEELVRGLDAFWGKDLRSTNDAG